MNCTQILLSSLLFGVSIFNVILYLYLRKRCLNLKNHCSYHNSIVNPVTGFNSDSFDIFTRIMVHDLKAPLFAIRNLASWIVEDAQHLLPHESQRHMDLLLKRIKRMETLLADIFTYFFKTNPSEDYETLHWVLFFESLQETIEIPEEFKISDQTGLGIIKTNGLLLQIVLTNLLTNAIKYHDDVKKGRVIITCKQQGKMFEFTVSDNGPGISQEYFDDIFKPLKKLEGHDKIEGSGLGLSIVKKIIIQQGGTVRVTSKLGEGSNFIFTWPSC